MASPKTLNPSLIASGLDSVSRGIPHCTEMQASQQHGRSYSRHGALPKLPIAQIPHPPSLTAQSGALRPLRSTKTLPAQGGRSKMEDAHPSGEKRQPWIWYSLLKNDQAGKNWKITKGYQWNREKSDIIYAQSGILYSSENAEKLKTTCDNLNRSKKTCRLKEARHKEDVLYDSNNIKFQNKQK